MAASAATALLFKVLPETYIQAKYKYNKVANAWRKEAEEHPREGWLKQFGHKFVAGGKAFFSTDQDEKRRGDAMIGKALPYIGKTLVGIGKEAISLPPVAWIPEKGLRRPSPMDRPPPKSVDTIMGEFEELPMRIPEKELRKPPTSINDIFDRINRDHEVSRPNTGVRIPEYYDDWNRGNLRNSTFDLGLLARRGGADANTMLPPSSSERFHGDKADYWQDRLMSVMIDTPIDKPLPIEADIYKMLMKAPTSVATRFIDDSPEIAQEMGKLIGKPTSTIRLLDELTDISRDLIHQGKHLEPKERSLYDRLKKLDIINPELVKTVFKMPKRIINVNQEIDIYTGLIKKFGRGMIGQPEFKDEFKKLAGYIYPGFKMIGVPREMRYMKSSKRRGKYWTPQKQMLAGLIGAAMGAVGIIGGIGGGIGYKIGQKVHKPKIASIPGQAIDRKNAPVLPSMPGDRDATPPSIPGEESVLTPRYPGRMVPDLERLIGKYARRIPDPVKPQPTPRIPTGGTTHGSRRIVARTDYQSGGISHLMGTSGKARYAKGKHDTRSKCPPGYRYSEKKKKCVKKKKKYKKII